MKNWILTAALVGILLTVALPIASILSGVRKERIVTTFSLRLHVGANSVQLRVPKGEYLCVLSGSDQLLRGVASIMPISSKATLEIKSGNTAVIQSSTNGSMKFYINNDLYRPVCINCNVTSSDSKVALFMTVGGTF